MPYVNGTVNSADELREAIRSFATRTLGNYEDLFDGSLGLSAFATGNYSVLGLRHRETQGVILFDVVNGLSMNNLDGEHVLLGQLLSTVSGALKFDVNLYFDQEGETIFRLDPGLSIQRTTATATRPGGTEEFQETTFTATSIDGVGPFSPLELGQALIVNVAVGGYDYHIFEIHELTDVDEGASGYSQTIKAEYIASYNTDGTSSTSVTVPNNTSDSGLHLRTAFSARDTELLRDTKFNEFTTNMWGETLTTDEIAEGWFPRSGRLDFSAGVEVEFFGDTSAGNDYFHMVLNNVGSDRVTHWWTGRVSAPTGTMTEPGQAAVSFGTEMATTSNSNGLFLGTSGPHTDKYGTDTYQYPFSFKAADEAYKNPCAIVTNITNDGANETLAQDSGGRYGYGPTGANHKNKYGPNLTVYRVLQSQRYSIQSGLNGFGGGHAQGMTGARGRTYYPLRPASAASGEQYLQPWAPVEATLYSSPMTSDQSGVTGVTADPVRYVADIVSTLPNTTENDDGFAEQALTTTRDPQASFWAPGTLSYSVPASGDQYDRVEVRFRIKDPGDYGGRARENGTLFITTNQAGQSSFSDSGNQVAIAPEDVDLDNDQWQTMQLTLPANWVNTGAGEVITGLRVDLFQYSATGNPIVQGATIEWDYVTVGETKVQRDATYQGSDGAYAVSLGQIPGVSRVTMEPAADNASKLRSRVVIEGETYVSIEASKYNTEPQPGLLDGLARPHDPTTDSGLAGYVYKR